MNCPKCGYVCNSFDRTCPSCGKELPVGTDTLNPIKVNSIEYEGGFLDAVLFTSGRALKFLAKFVLVIGVIVSFILAIMMFTEASDLRGSAAAAARWSGILYIILGPVVSYLSSLSTYALGYIFDTVAQIQDKLNK